METLVLVVHVLAALSIIGLILLQQGKGAAMGASFGSGASQTVFGSSGGGHFLVKVTAVVALVFFITSFSLAVIAKRSAAPEQDITLPGFEQEVPVVDEQNQGATQSDVPVIEDSAPNSDVPIVEEPQETESDVPAADAQPEEQER